MSGRETKPAPVAAESAAEKPSWSKYDEVTDRDIFLIKYMGAKTPIVPLGCVITAGILFSGFWQFKQGNKQQAQQVFRVGPFPQPLAGQVEALLRPLILALPQMMRARVAAQAVTLSLMMTSLWVQERQKKLGLWPKDPRAG